MRGLAIATTWLDVRSAILLLTIGVIGSTAARAECLDGRGGTRLAEQRPGRLEITMTPSARVSRDLALAGDALVWTSGQDVWRLPDGGRGCLEHIAALPRPAQPTISSRLAVGGEALVEVTQTTVRELGQARIPIALPETPLASLVHDGALYTTVFRGDAIYRIDLATGQLGTFATLPAQSGRFGLVLAQHGDSLYVASYGQRWLAELPFATGTMRTIARGFATGPTALAVDGTNAYVYLESSRRSTGSLQRVVLATGKARALATNLINSDGVLLDDGWLYLRTAAGRRVDLVRVPADGSGGVELVERELPAGSRPVAADAEAIYLDAAGQVIRLEKSQLVTRTR
ncbi:hypothetical protein BH11MYX3_BH11MYX3_34060 [soil metagenome]